MTSKKPTASQAIDSAINYGTIFDFSNAQNATQVGVSLATLLQCLCIAEQRHLVPPLEPEWEQMTIPSILRNYSTLQIVRVDAGSNWIDIDGGDSKL
jgi:hypothetical protein